MTPPVQHHIPEASDLQAFDHAVAGHAGTMRDISGAMFIKPCVQKEIDFYEEVNANHPQLARIMPVFLGKLSLYKGGTPKQAVQQITEAEIDSLSETEASSTPTPTPTPAPEKNTEWVKKGSGSIDTDRAIVLENITHGYRHPNILDVKLGKRLYADNAAEKKIEHMKLISDQTTHKNFGFRIAGMRVWNGEGTAGTASESSSKKASPSIRVENGYTVYDKDYGRKEVNDDNVVEAFRRFVFNEAAGIDKEHGRAVAAAFKADLQRVCKVLEEERTCMFSSSLLFVFEGDGDALKIAIAENNAAADKAAAGFDNDNDDDAVSRASSVEPTVMAASVSINDIGSIDNISDLGGLSEAMGMQIQQIQGLQSQGSPRKRRRIESPIPVHQEPEAILDGQVEDALHLLRASSRRVVLGKASDRSSSRTDSGIVINDEDEQDDQDEQNNQTDRIDHIVTESFTIEDEGDDAASTTDTETSSELSLRPVHTLRLIDFAHASFVDDKRGPDENNLLGVRKLIEVFDELCK